LLFERVSPMLVAHIAGIPVEETALTMAPVATALAGAMLRNVRRRVSFSVRSRRP
jgi:hypothetical protein